MKIAKVSNDNVDTVRSWSLTLAAMTLIHKFAVIWSQSCSTFVEILRNFMELLRFFLFLFTLPAVCLSLSSQYGATSCWGWWNGLQTWSLAANVLNKQSRTEVKWCSFVLGRGANKYSTQKLTMLRNTSAWGGAGSCECGNGHPDSVKCGEFLDYLWTSWIIRNVLAPSG